jgi:MFS family permease
MKNKVRIVCIWTVVSLFMVLHFFLMLSVGVITTDLRLAFNMTALELSFLSSSYLYIYLALQTPAGILLDHYGARRLLGIGGLVCGFACLTFAQSEHFWLSISTRIFTGAGLAFVFISSIQLASRWFAPRYFGMMIGFSEAAAMIGAIIGNMLLAVFIHAVGWRFSFQVAGVLACILGVLAWVFIRDYPAGYKISERSKLTLSKVKHNIKFLAKKRDIWMQSAYIALMYVSITVFCGLWANPFLRRAYDLTLEQSTLSSCLILVGIGAGSPIAGVLCDTYDKRIKCMRWCAISMLLVMCMILYFTNLSYIAINLLMLLLGVSGSSLILSFAIVSDIAPEGAKSTSVGLTNTFSLTSAIVFQPFVGWLLNLLSNQVGANGLDSYTAHDYRLALSIIPVLMLGAIWLSFKCPLKITNHQV